MQHDFFKGYEGEPEIIIYSKNQDQQVQDELRMWSCHFSGLVEQIPVAASGLWEGVALYYHLDIAWYEEENWRCEEQAVFLQKFADIDCSQLEEPSREILSLIIKLLQASIEQSYDLYFHCE